MAFFAGSLLISNLALQMGVVRGKLERKLEKRSGVSWAIGSLSWTPWTGVQVRHVAVEAPALGGSPAARPLCRAELDLKVHWSSLLRGALDLREVRVRSGQIAIPMELLSLLPSEEVQSPVGPSEPSLVPVPRPERKEDLPEPAKKKQKPGPSTGHEKTGSAVASTFRIIIDQCDLEVYSNEAKGTPALKLRNFSGELPLGGKDASGLIRCEGISIGSQFFKVNWASPVQWKHPSLNLPPAEIVWNGFTIRSEGVLQMTRTPRFAARIDIPASEWASDSGAFPSALGLKLQAKRLSLRGALNGNLARLSSWKGDLAVEARGVALGGDRNGQEVFFNEGRMIATVRGGRFNLLEARLQSERLSFLGNGALLPDGRLGGVMRVVADQDYAALLTRFAIGAMWTGGWTRSWLVPMETPDRYYRDIILQGTVNQTMVDVGRKGEAMDLAQAWNRMRTFLRKEALEPEKRTTARPAEQIFPQ